jgi:hypothetical protein
VEKWRRKVTSFETSIGKQSVGEPPIHRLPPDINLNNWTYAYPELSPLEFLHPTTQDARYGGSNLRQNLDFADTGNIPSHAPLLFVKQLPM